MNQVGDDRTARSALLAAAASELGLPLSAQQSAQMLDFVDLLRRWNVTYNLTAIRDPSAMLNHHVIDCLAAVRPLRREMAVRNATRVLDVGSGGGLPGIVFAATNPQVEVTCVESVGKKTAFLQQAAATLGLDNLRVEHARVEAMPRVAAYDIVVSRAFASLTRFAELTADVLAPRGVWMAMKGKPPNDEVLALPREVEMFHVEHLSVPHLDASRTLVWMRKRESVHQHISQFRSI